MGILAGSSIRFKGRKDYTNTIKLDIIIIGDMRERKDDNFNNFNNNKDYKRLKFSNLISIMVNGRSLNFNFFNLLYSFGIILPLLKKENELFILLI